MNTRLVGIVIFICVASMLSVNAYATDKPHKKMTLAEKGEQARIESAELEQTQLQKARDAANATAEREQKVLAKQEANDWEAQQLEKAQTQSEQRLTREQKYLQQAQEAAAQTRKIPKETIDPAQSE